MIQINWMKTVLEFAIIIKTTIFEKNIPLKNVAFMRFKIHGFVLFHGGTACSSFDFISGF